MNQARPLAVTPGEPAGIGPECLLRHCESHGTEGLVAVADPALLRDTARLLRTRGAAMQSAVPVGEGAMAAVLGLARGGGGAGGQGGADEDGGAPGGGGYGLP